MIKDKKRQIILMDMGLSFLRFDDLDIIHNMAFVLEEIDFFIGRWEVTH